MPSSYHNFFTTATGHLPYLWQCRLACGEPPEGANGDLDNPDEKTTEWLSGSHPNPCASRLIDIPTGLGKTAGVVLAWLWNRMGSQTVTSNDGSQNASPWPRRLVYCLPMRTLVEQTEGEVKEWLSKVGQTASLSPNEENDRQDACPTFQRPRVVVLMGGEDPGDKDWDLYPEEPAILIGTQDMLLSRALNRGYGMSRYRWPMHFGLLNNDALWVMDEVQLMGPGLATTTQLEGFRNALEELGSQGCRSWWMSATIRPDWLTTVDMPGEVHAKDPLRLSENEKHDGSRVEALRTASKEIKQATTDSGAKNLKEVAKFIGENRSDNGLNLVVVNTVPRARELHKELAKFLKGEPQDLLLLHSQFRQQDRQHVLDAIAQDQDQDPSGKIVVSTQVIEAGVDLSAHTLFTEIAPWSSLVQRFGRCNRRLVDGHAHYADARILWFDIKDHPPYPSAAIAEARTCLTNLSNAAIECLETVESPDADRPEFRHVIRRKDLVDLFDTTTDLAGADLDIDRFIRDADDSHVRAFWRDWRGNTPNADEDGNEPQKGPARNELCAVGVGDFRAFIKKHGPAWRWNPLDRAWQKVPANDIYPGQTYLLHISQGGYDDGDVAGALPTGWTADPKNKPKAAQAAGLPQPNEKDRQAACSTVSDAYDGDPASQSEQWQTIAQHTDRVCDELDAIIDSLGHEVATMSNNPDLPLAETLRQAARWHDWGKAHASFQAKLDKEERNCAKIDGPAAKAPETAWIKGRIPRKPAEDDHRRPHFRHELASALAVLLPDSGFPEVADNAHDLAAYLIAAHHGKVRLSIRSMPDEWVPTPPKTEDDQDRRFARGIWDGDALPGTDLGEGATANPIRLSLEPMELGLGEREPFLDQPSWAERCLTLRDTLGPFALAYLETLLRAADGRASKVGQAASRSTSTKEVAIRSPTEKRDDNESTPNPETKTGE